MYTFPFHRLILNIKWPNLRVSKDPKYVGKEREYQTYPKWVPIHISRLYLINSSYELKLKDNKVLSYPAIVT